MRLCKKIVAVGNCTVILRIGSCVMTLPLCALRVSLSSSSLVSMRHAFFHKTSLGKASVLGEE